MSAKANQIQIGAFVVGGLALVVAAVAVLGSGRLFRHAYPFVSYFDGSVNGLRAGAAVKFKGVEIGSVDRIRIPFRVDATDQPIAVFFSLDGPMLDAGTQRAGDHREILQEAIENGLRAQLESDSLLTGVLHVSLAFTTETESSLHPPIDGVMEIPTIPPPLQEIGTAIRTIVEKVARYDIHKLLATLEDALASVSQLTRSPELKTALVSLDKTLQSADTAFTKLEERIDPLFGSLEEAAQSLATAGRDAGEGVDSVKETMETMQRFTAELGDGLQPLLASLKQSSDALQTLAHELEISLASARVLLDPDAPIAVELQTTVRALGDAARSTRALFELLERDPAVLLRGKSSEGLPPR